MFNATSVLPVGVRTRIDSHVLMMLAGFIRMCDDGWRQGWHERNGGNLSYRLSADESIVLRSLLSGRDPGEWVSAGHAADPVLGCSHFAVTGSGGFMRNVASDPCVNLGIIEMDPAGAAWRLVWGLDDGGRPTSELATHLMCHAASMRGQAPDGGARVMYHAHTPRLNAMTYVLPHDDRTFSRALWKSLTESAIVFPEGVGVVSWMPPGSEELARASAAKMTASPAVVWAHHGAICAGPTFDETFGLLHTIEKAAGIYLDARAANAGSDAFLSTISDGELRRLACAFDLPLRQDFLD